ncbi:MAG: hypothetical protein WC421_06860 [Elusimicrobiales bacterium]
MNSFGAGKMVISVITLAMTVAAAVSAQENISIANGGNLRIDAFGTCKVVTNNTGHALYVPVYSAGEWTGTNGFIAKHGSNITLSECGCLAQTVTWSNCSGSVGALAHGGSTSVSDSRAVWVGSAVTVTCNSGTLSQSSPSCFHWYAGTRGQGGDGSSCTTTCSSHGGYNAATKTYAGSAGTDAHCQSVLNTLGITDTWSSPGCNQAIGCSFFIITTGRCTVDTTADATAYNSQRACACNQ